MNKEIFVAIYIRVSTTHQVEEGFSLDAQENKLRQICELNGYKIYKVYADKGISGKDTIHRPAFQEMMEDMEKGLFSKILVMKLDRISRSVADLENIIKQLQKHNCGFESASEKIDTTSSMGLMFIRLLGVFAQFERERIAERIKDAFDEKIKQGGAVTRSLPMGYKIGTDDKGKKIVIKDIEKEEIVKDMFDTYERTNSLQKTADYLNEKYPDKLNKYMATGQGISRALDSKMYYGYYRGNDSYCEPYVSKERWERLNEIKKSKNIKGYKHTFIFSGILKSSCGHYLVGHFCHGENAYRCKIYSTNKKCSCNSVREKYVEKQFLDKLNDSLIEYIDKYTIKISNSKYIDNTKKIKSLEEKKQKIISSFINGWINEDAAKSEINQIEVSIKELKKDNKIEDIEALKKIINSNWREKYNHFTKEEKQAFIRNLNIDYIYIDHEKYNQGWRDRKPEFLTIYFK